MSYVNNNNFKLFFTHLWIFQYSCKSLPTPPPLGPMSAPNTPKNLHELYGGLMKRLVMTYPLKQKTSHFISHLSMGVDSFNSPLIFLYTIWYLNEYLATTHSYSLHCMNMSLSMSMSSIKICIQIYNRNAIKMQWKL